MAFAGCATGGADKPFRHIENAPQATLQYREPMITASNMRLEAVPACHVSTLDYWCDPDFASCQKKPTLAKHDVACPERLKTAALNQSSVTVIAPWHKEYPASITEGRLEVAVDWAKPENSAAAIQLAPAALQNWQVRTATGVVPMTLSADNVTAVLHEANRTSNDAAARPNEHAALTVKLTNDAAAGVNHITVMVSNSGPDAAYNVNAQLRSSSLVLHGLKFAFGRMARGESKKLTQDVVLADGDDLSPTVVATASADDADQVAANSRLKLTMPLRRVKLGLQCTTVDAESGPGQVMRVHCEASNPDAEAVHGLALQVTFGGGAQAAPGGAPVPTEIASHGRFKLELAPKLPAGVKIGSTLPLSITLSSPEGVTVEQKLSVHVIDAHGVCKKGKLSRDAYSAKRKRLEAALAAKTLTQEEFDAYDADMVSCLE